MKIKYYGHACFQIYDKDNDSVVIDPYDESIGLGTLELTTDKLLISHEHYDHNFRKGVILNDSQVNTFKTKVIKCYHDNENGKLRGENKIHIIEVDGKVICHLGDLGHLLTGEMIDDIGKVDILMIPVGGVYTINYNDAIDIINKINSKIIIPMHYNLKQCNIELEDIEKFEKSISDTREIFKIKNDELVIDDSLKTGVYILK